VTRPEGAPADGYSAEGSGQVRSGQGRGSGPRVRLLTETLQEGGGGVG